MEVVTLRSAGSDVSFSLRGECPHCDERAVCTIVGQPYMEEIPAFPVRSQLENMLYASPAQRWCAITQCPGCKKYVLAIVTRQPHPTSPGQPSKEPFRYEAHYPMGTPNDLVSEEIPEGIRENFKEAIRCLFVNAPNATAEMCRRAIEGSCIEFGAPPKTNLEDKIDWMATERKITPFLAEVAHKIRLGGNRGAHYPESSTNESAISLEQAAAIVKFTREYFNYIYVVRHELDKYDFSKPKKIAAAP